MFIVSSDIKDLIIYKIIVRDDSNKKTESKSHSVMEDFGKFFQNRDCFERGVLCHGQKGVSRWDL